MVRFLYAVNWKIWEVVGIQGQTQGWGALDLFSVSPLPRTELVRKAMQLIDRKDEVEEVRGADDVGAYRA